MATSYTSLLGLALPVTGELDGTWGDTVNNSITSLLDTAIAGTTTLSTDADVTLTTTTGASNQARQAILLCSGARTAVRNITAPAQSKIYAVVNNTTGGYGVVIRGVGPTTGVTVANGKTAVVVWNGSDFVEVAPATSTTATNLAGGAAGSVPYQTGSGATTFLSIGTANQVLQVNAGATAPEWVSSTGTGNVVRATSPTIATPTITTSATVPLLIGGTGTTSTLTLRSTSGVGTTGADIIFQVGNNGATEAMRVQNAGRLLITGGTTTGMTKQLNIYTAAEATILLSADSTGETGLAFRDQTASTNWGGFQAFNNSSSNRYIVINNGGERVRIDSGGNVGIGASTLLGNTRLHVAQNADANYATTFTPGTTKAQLVLRDLSDTATYTNPFSALTFVAGSSGAGASYIAGARESAGASFLAFGTGTASTVTERMRIDSSGNLGLGVTAVPYGASNRVVHVDGGANSAEIRLTNNTTGTSAVNGALFQQSGNDLYIWNVENSFVSFGTNNAERVRLDSTGRWLIGQTASRGTVAASLQVSDSRISVTSATNGIIGGLAPASSISNSLTVEADPDNVAASSFIRFTIDSTEWVRIAGTGNIGFGTASPAARLQLDGSLTASAWTTTGIGVVISAATYTDSSTAASGTVASAGIHAIARPTIAASNASVTYTNAATLYIANSPANGTNVTVTNPWSLWIAAGNARFDGAVSLNGSGALGYGTGSGGTVTQATSRTTGVTINKTNGAITLVSAAGSTTFQSFTVTNSTVAATDTIIVNQKSGTDLYRIHVTNVAAGSFQITFATVSGTTTEQPVFNFAVIKAVTA